MSGHTPGPWSWTNDDGAVRIMARLSPSDGLAVLADADEANARLIAAAPDLLEVALTWRTLLIDAGVADSDLSWSMASDALDDAIAKATGSQVSA